MRTAEDVTTAIDMTREMLDAHRSARIIAGDQFDVRIVPYRAAIMALVTVDGASVLQATLQIGRGIPKNGGELLWLLAAAVEVMREKAGNP